MMEGIVDNLKVIGSMAFRVGFMPTSDGNRVWHQDFGSGKECNFFKNHTFAV
jgi:hypothetical protein